jgi:hypothetical protein
MADYPRFTAILRRATLSVEHRRHLVVLLRFRDFHHLILEDNGVAIRSGLERALAGSSERRVV